MIVTGRFDKPFNNDLILPATAQTRDENRKIFFRYAIAVDFFLSCFEYGFSYEVLCVSAFFQSWIFVVQCTTTGSS